MQRTGNHNNTFGLKQNQVDMTHTEKASDYLQGKQSSLPALETASCQNWYTAIYNVTTYIRD